MDFVVFLNTNLGSRLAISVQYNDTIRDLKGRIMVEYANIFPNIRQLDVLAVKVEINGTSYHLSDLTMVRNVFEGSTRDRFLHVDLTHMVDNITLPVTLPMIKGSQSEVPDTDQLNSVQIQCENDIVGKKSMDKKRKKKSSIHIHQTVDKLDSETRFDVTSLGKIWIADEACNQVDKADVRNSVSTKNGEHEFQMERSNILEVRETGVNPVKKVNIVPLPKVAPPSNHVQDLKDVDHVEGPKSAAEPGNLAEYFSSQVGNLKLKRKRHKKISNLHLQDSSTISANVECQSVPFMGQTPARDFESKDRQRKSVYDQLNSVQIQCENDIVAKKSMDKKRKKKSSIHIHQTVDKLDSETRLDVTSLGKIWIADEACNQVDKSDVRNSLSTKNGEHEFQMERSNILEVRETGGNPEKKVNIVPLPKVAPPSNHAQDLKDVDHVEGPESAAEPGNVAEYFSSQVGNLKLKRKRHKKISNLHLQDSSTISANVECQSVPFMGVTPARDFESKDRQRKSVYDRLNSVQIQCENDIVGMKSMDKKRKKKSSIHIHQTVDKLDSETRFDVTSLGKIWIADEAYSQVDKADVRNSLSTKNGEHEFQMERSNILEVRETGGNPEKKVNIVPLPKVAPPSNHAQDLKDVDHVEGPKSAAEPGNLAEYFSSQVGNLKPKRKRQKKISNLHLQDSSTISANVECQSVPFMGETTARDFESKDRQRKSVYDQLNSVQIQCENDIVGMKSMDKKRKKKSSIHIHQTVDKLDSETRFDVTSLGKIWIADEGCSQVDKADVRNSLSTKNGEHEFQMERSNILEVRETGGNPEKKVNIVPLPKVAPPSNHVQDLKDVDHVEGPTSAAEPDNLAEYFSSQVGNLKLKLKRHKKISNLHLQDSSTISANVECQSVPFMGETPARDFESKDRQRKSVYDQLNSVQIQCENDIVGKKSMDKKRKNKSSIHIHQTVDKLDSETRFDVTSLGKIWIADEACNQVDKADVRNSLSTKNGEHEFQMERSNILEVRETGGNPEKKVNIVPLPKVAPPSNHVQDLKDVDHVEGPRSAAEPDNLAEYFSSQVGNLKLKRKRHKKISNLHLQDSSTISANVECQLVPFMGETPAPDFESKGRQRKSVYDQLNSVQIQFENDIVGKKSMDKKRKIVQNCNFGPGKTSLSAPEKFLIHINNVLEDEPQEVNDNISPKGSSSTPFGNGHVSQASMDDQGEIKSLAHSGKSKQSHRNVTATSTSGPHVGSKITRRGVQFPSAPRSRPAEAKLMAIFQNSRHYRKVLLQLLQNSSQCQS